MGGPGSSGPRARSPPPDAGPIGFPKCDIQGPKGYPRPPAPHPPGVTHKTNIRRLGRKSRRPASGDLGPERPGRVSPTRGDPATPPRAARRPPRLASSSQRPGGRLTSRLVQGSGSGLVTESPWRRGPGFWEPTVMIPVPFTVTQEKESNKNAHHVPETPKRGRERWKRVRIDGEADPVRGRISPGSQRVSQWTHRVDIIFIKIPARFFVCLFVSSRIQTRLFKNV